MSDNQKVTIEGKEYELTPVETSSGGILNDLADMFEGAIKGAVEVVLPKP